MFVAQLMAERELEVWDCLAAVSDPELDEPITDLNFVEAVSVNDDHTVRVEFRLPTYWCSPNFAFLMAFGIRNAVMALPWVRAMTVELKDHCFGDEVNDGVNSGRPFHQIFAENCDGAVLDDVVEKFMAKAFDRRQEAMLLALKAKDRPIAEIVSMTVGALKKTHFTGEEAFRQLPRYLDILAAKGLALTDRDPAFPTWQGGRISPEALGPHLRRLRSTRLTMEFNGALCRGLAQSRYKEVEIGIDGPTLVDFIAGRVPPREAPEPGI
ncbi:iron-sulfur cluster assembly protein [Celeribacter neptunius]|uniref:Metal-sulfur cluster biosynthetic enzyme n=1 Tax=Celeribacter neptunius TaxID=588602 RepID=A0A1I3VM17_9RHOB|nr:iron-sulfur cluster assembly protein [Celeribacter neptunius]SFJ96202.1 Metal-sulfur cluster biosynthetic enzyme [Celeribacter neptunius]